MPCNRYAPAWEFVVIEGVVVVVVMVVVVVVTGGDVGSVGGDGGRGERGGVDGCDREGEWQALGAWWLSSWVLVGVCVCSGRVGGTPSISRVAAARRAVSRTGTALFDRHVRASSATGERPSPCRVIVPTRTPGRLTA